MAPCARRCGDPRKRFARDAARIREEERAAAARRWLPVVGILDRAVEHAEADPAGIAKSKCGVILITEAFLKGRAWTERELGALASSGRRAIPILDSLSYENLAAGYPNV